MQKNKKILGFLILCLAIPAVILLGVTVFADRQYAWISLCISILSCVPFFMSFEKKQTDTQKLIILAVMVTLSVLGRFAFSFVPHFKPVTAIVVITGMYMGAESGFLCGALSAVVSNFIFGQGPWTPFQMFAWGLIGLLAGLLSKPLKKHKSGLFLFGAVSGVFYSFLLDIWTVLWWDGTFNFTRYIAAVISAIPVTAIYAVSNVLFLLLLAKPIGEKLQRIKTKYGIN